MRFCLFLLPSALTGCPAPQTEAPPSAPALTQPADKSAGAFADLDPWVLKTTDPAASRGNHGVYLANGRTGMTFGANGGTDDKSVAFAAGQYDKNESFAPSGDKMSGLRIAPGEPYTQTLNMRAGTLTTSSGNKSVTVALTADGGSFHSSLSGTPPSEEAAKQSSLDPHRAAWEKRWKDADIIIEGDLEAQQLVHKLQFDLMQSARPGGDDSIAPEALSGNFYKGHIFWDAEVWMFPALLPQRPELARTMLDYRFKHLKAAQSQARAQGCKGADFPWESAASGKETAPAGFSKGRHVTAGVGWATWHYYLATGDKQWMQERGWPLLAGVGDYFATRAKKNAATGKYDLADVTGPDEFAVGVTNNTYTNAMAQNCLRYAGEAARLLGKPANPQWKTVADNLALPFDKARGAYLKHDGDGGKPGTKQADGELLLWPAQLPMDTRTQAATFDFHKARVIKNGPAMTASIHALVAARLGRADEAAQHLRDSYRPFVRGPFLLFSEKRSLDRCVFTTGAGGVLQSVLYGFGGLDYTRKTGVIPGPVALPKGWKRLTITGIHRAGKRYTLTVTPQGRTLVAEK